MSIPYAAILFFVLVIGLGTLPFLPALREVRLHRDAAPLQVTRRSRVDVRHFARGFQQFVQRHFTGILDEARHAPRRVEGHSADLGSYVAVPEGGTIGLEEIGPRVLLGAGDVIVEGQGVIEREAYSQGDLDFRGAVSLRAALARHDLDLSAGSRVLRWAHAENRLVVGRDCILYGRASAGRAMVLDEGLRFERLHAPTIVVGHDPIQEVSTREPTERLAPEKLGPRVEFSGNRALVRGHAQIPDGVLLDYDVVARGDLRVGSGAQVRGSLKAKGLLWVGPEAWIEGSLVSEESIHVQEGARVHGPILSEETLHLARDVKVGDPDRPSTARGLRVEVAVPARIHGSLWASDEGKVVVS